MAKKDFTSVDEYIASQPEVVQGVLERVRRTIRNAVPPHAMTAWWRLVRLCGPAALS